MSDLTIRDLIDQLEQAAEQEGDNARVAFAIQPNYPLRQVAAAITTSSTLDGAEEPQESDEPGTVWIALNDDRERPYDVPAGVWEGRIY